MRHPITTLFLSSLLSGALLSGVPRNSSIVLFEDLGRWSYDGRQFQVFARPSYLLLNKRKKLVMVSYRALSDFESTIKLDKRTLAYFRNVDTGVARAILAVNSSEERDQLAGLVHEHTHLCGSIEVLDLNLNLTELGNADSPKVPTTTKSGSIAQLIDKVSASNMQSTVTTLQSLGSRYHASTSPNASSDLLKTSWQSLLLTGATISQLDHSASKDTSQKSLVVRIPAAQTSSDTVILGAHLDSINRSDQTNAPGADDNATGIAALTEILRILKESSATFSRNVEIHAYAAEEVGLLGSADLASQYATAGKNISAMLQMDMIGYSTISSDQTIHLVTTDTSPVLTRHLKDYIATYQLGTMQTGTLAAGTSDHKSWTNLGYHAAFAFENPTDYNHAIHSSSDTLDRLDFSLATRFTKLALAFLAHEAGLISAVTDTTSAWTTLQSTSGLIKLAAFKSNDAQRLAAAVTGAAATAEFCRVKAGAEFGCQAMITDTSIAKEKSGQVFFVTASDVTITEDEIWRVSAYTSSGELLAMRSARLKKN